MHTLQESPELADHLAGVPLREIGENTGVSHEQVRRIIQAQGREIVTRIAGQLLLARREGRVLPVATIPDTRGQGFHLGLRWIDWLVGELADLTLSCRVHIEPIVGGYEVGLSELERDAEGGV